RGSRCRCFASCRSASSCPWLGSCSPCAEAGCLRIPHRKYLLILSLLLAIRPWNRQDWLAENALAIVAAALILGYHRKLLLSRVSYTLIFIFMCLHEVGA